MVVCHHWRRRRGCVCEFTLLYDLFWPAARWRTRSQTGFDMPLVFALYVGGTFGLDILVHAVWVY